MRAGFPTRKNSPLQSLTQARPAKGQQDHHLQSTPSAEAGHCRVPKTSHLGDLSPLSTIQDAHLLPTTTKELSLNTCHGPWTHESPGTLHSPTTQVRTRGPGSGLQSESHISPPSCMTVVSGGRTGEESKWTPQTSSRGAHVATLALAHPLASPCPLAARGKRGKLTLSPRQQLQRRNDTAVLVPQPPA